MAAKETGHESCASKSKHKTNTGQVPHNGGHSAAFREYLCRILNSLTEFGVELKVGAAALSITADVSSVDMTVLQPGAVFTSLQQHISKLQAVSANLKQLVEAESEEVPRGHGGVQGEKQAGQSSERGLAAASSGLAEEVGSKVQSAAHDNAVQIKAGKSEIDRRISAFIERKQLEINENNVREFCNVIDCNQENSCARTDAVFTPYPGFKSHIKVTRVVNTYGPQTRGARPDVAEPLPQHASLSSDCGNQAIEERLQNMEAHLRLPTVGPVPQTVYQRLKKLEDRILELEGLSPEYFQSTGYLHKRPKASDSQAYSLTELDGKISAVKAALLKRMSEFRSTEAGDFPY